ncbi:MAG: hypothetical protein KC502_20960 [Myxococcales bacterium]|nr:hypothetical protein [Myxococcales bacterium]
MSLRALRFAFIFTMGLPAHLPAQAFAGPGRPNRGGRAGLKVAQHRARGGDPLQKWANSGYHYCDAKMIASMWHTTPYAAKKAVGRKLLRGNYREVRLDLANARRHARRHPAAACNYHQAGYTYRDAEKLASIWHVSVAQAKTMIANKVLNGGDRQVRKLLRPRRNRGVVGGHRGRMATKSPHMARKTFLTTGHTYCDAKALGAMWRSGPQMAKTMGGYMLMGGGRKMLGGNLQMARKLAMRTRKGACSFSEAGFSPRDANKLAKMWRTTPKKARAQAERKILWGAERDLRKMLRNPRR